MNGRCKGLSDAAATTALEDVSVSATPLSQRVGNLLESIIVNTAGTRRIKTAINNDEEGTTLYRIYRVCLEPHSSFGEPRASKAALESRVRQRRLWRAACVKGGSHALFQ